MEILVTGGAGFIGSHTVEALLARGERVIALDNFNTYYDPTRKHKNVAQFMGRRVNEENPYLDARLPDGSRVAIVLPPCSRKGPGPSPIPISDLRSPGPYIATAPSGRQNSISKKPPGTLPRHSARSSASKPTSPSTKPSSPKPRPPYPSCHFT